jgi:hypothetical protein
LKAEAKTRFLVALVFGTVLAACGSTNTSASDGGSDAGMTDGEAWLVQTTVQGPEDRSTYTQVVSSLDVDTIDNRAGLETPGNGRLFYLDPANIFMGSSSTPSITRYALNGTSFVAGESVSFAAAGFGFLPYGNTFASAERAFLLEGSALAGIVWNPSARTAGPVLDLAPLARDGFELTLDPGVVRGDRLFVPLQYANLASLSVFPGVAVAVFDVPTAALVTVITDTRCVGGYAGLELAEDGTIYAMGDGYSGLTRLLDPSTPQTCLLRIRAGEEVFDASWTIALPELLGGRDGIGLVYAGDGIAFVPALYPEELAVSPADDLFGALDSQAARWWRVDLNARTAGALDLPFHSIANAVGYTRGGRTFLAVPDRGQRGTTQLFEVNAMDGAVVRRARFTGLLTALERVQ